MNIKALVSHTPIAIPLTPRRVCKLFMTDNDAKITLLEISSAQQPANPQSVKCSVVWLVAFFALLCMWGQGGRREREGGGSHFTRYGINESFTLQEFHLRDHPLMTSYDFFIMTRPPFHFVSHCTPYAKIFVSWRLSLQGAG